jgi:3-deoxy-manno-octulosonate cytidylyltransferase (CMP-KDO synthetase)
VLAKKTNAMKFACLIPARLQSTRLPKKLLEPLGNFSVIQTTFQNVVATKLFSEVIVITDDLEIKNSIEAIGGTAWLSTNDYNTGTDRIAAFANQVEADVIINVQGDEPFTSKQILEQLINCFEDDKILVASLMHPIADITQINNPNCVKVICDINQNAILFSRNPIPFDRDNTENIIYYKHIGIYAFTKSTLILFSSLPQPSIEKAENLENLRFIYNNIPIRMLETNYQPIGIDTFADLEQARLML